MIKRHHLPLVALIPLVFLAQACGGGGSDVPTSDIVSRIPWSGDESLNYRLVDDDGDMVGEATLSIDVLGPQNTGPQTELRQSFRSGSNTDETRVVVDSATLKPASSTREIRSPDDTETVEVTYTEAGALIKQGERQSGISVPEHAYDNDTSLWLWRTIRFEPGYEASYTTIITNRRDRQRVTVKVIDRETITVPAGQFNAWRVEIRGSNARQVAWYADSGSMPLLRYDNDRNLIFELTSRP